MIFITLLPYDKEVVAGKRNRVACRPVESANSSAPARNVFAKCLIPPPVRASADLPKDAESSLPLFLQAVCGAVRFFGMSATCRSRGAHTLGSPSADGLFCGSSAQHNKIARVGRQICGYEEATIPGRLGKAKGRASVGRATRPRGLLLTAPPRRTRRTHTLQGGGYAISLSITARSRLIIATVVILLLAALLVPAPTFDLINHNQELTVAVMIPPSGDTTIEPFVKADDYSTSPKSLRDAQFCDCIYRRPHGRPAGGRLVANRLCSLSALTVSTSWPPPRTISKPSFDRPVNWSVFWARAYPRAGHRVNTIVRPSSSFARVWRKIENQRAGMAGM